MRGSDGELAFADAAMLTRLLRERSISCSELITETLRRVDELNPALNAYVRVLEDDALEAAAAADAALAAGRAVGPLHGIPVAVKDTDFVAGVPNTSGSRLLQNFVPEQDAIHVARLRRAGAIIVGKTNTPEFGHKGVTDNLLFGATSTPFARGFNAGGSSGGSAAAVAAGLAVMATGGDGGGSIRIPAAMCGTFGFKPSFGRVPIRNEPNSYLWQNAPFVSIGPLTRTVADSALMTAVMAGIDAADPLSIPSAHLGAPNQDGVAIRGLRVAFSPDLGGFPVEREIIDAIQDTLDAMQKHGATLSEVDINLGGEPSELADVWLQYSAARIVEIAHNARNNGIDLEANAAQVTPEFTQLIARGRRMSALDYRLLDHHRSKVYDAIEGVLKGVDFLVTPTLCTSRVKNRLDGLTLGPREVNGVPTEPLIGWCLTFPLNFTGHPAASLPVGLTHDGLPIGMQIVGKRFADRSVLDVCNAIEHMQPWAHLYR